MHYSTILRISMCGSSPKNLFFDRSAAKHSEAVEAVRSDGMTSRAAAKTSSIFVCLQQKRVTGNASKADGVGQAPYCVDF